MQVIELCEVAFKACLCYILMSILLLGVLGAERQFTANPLNLLSLVRA